MFGLPGPNLGLAESRGTDSLADCVVLDGIDFTEEHRDIGVVGDARISRYG